MVLLALAASVGTPGWATPVADDSLACDPFADEARARAVLAARDAEPVDRATAHLALASLSQRQLEAGAHARAVDHLAQATALLRGLPPAAEVRRALASSLVVSSHLALDRCEVPELGRHVEACEGVFEPSDGAASVGAHLACLLHGTRLTDDPAQVSRLLDRAEQVLREAPQVPLGAAAVVESWHAGVRARTHGMVAGLMHLDAAIEAAGGLCPAEVARLNLVRGIVLSRSGRPAEGLARSQHACAALRALGAPCHEGEGPGALVGVSGATLGVDLLPGVQLGPTAADADAWHDPQTPCRRDCASVWWEVSPAERMQCQKELVQARRAVSAVLPVRLAGDLVMLGRLSVAAGHPLEAIGAFEEAIGLYERHLHPTPGGLALVRGELTAAFAQAGAYGEALAVGALAMEGGREAGDLVLVAEVSQSLGVVLLALGEGRAALDVLSEARDLEAELWGADSVQAAVAASFLGQAHEAVGDKVEGASLHRLAIARLRSEPGMEGHLALTLYRLGVNAVEQGQLDAAVLTLQEALAVSEGAVLPVVVASGALHDALGRAHLLRGEPEAAQEQLELALGWYGRSLGPEHMSVLGVQLALGAIEWAQGERVVAAERVERALSLGELRLAQLEALPTHQALSYVSTLHLLLGVWLRAHTDASPEEAWRHALALKGAATRHLRTRAGLARSHPEEAVREAAAALERARELLAHQALARAPGSPRVEGQLAGLSAEVIRAERVLADVLGEEVSAVVAAPTPAAVCAGLPPGVLLIDLLRSGHQDQHTYVAFVTDATCAVSRIELGDALTLDEGVQAWTRLIASGADPTFVAAAGQEVARRLLGPLGDHLAVHEQLWLVPDGSLHALPWAALPVSDTAYLVQRHEIVVLSSVDDVLRPRAPAGVGLVTVGGVDYDRAEAATSPEVVVSRLAPCDRQAFPPLPATAEESTRLGRQWRRWSREPVMQLGGAAATPEAVGAAAQGARVLHLATHGYFADRACMTSMGFDEQVAAVHPLLLTGLALAGANPVPGGSASGVWTGEQVAGLDLGGVELVLLSACETGAGTPRAWEGLHGLERAFAVAGARQVVTSLWPVEDEAAARLMGQLTSAWLRDPEAGVSAALREAQLSALASARARDGEDGLRDWAAWRVAGR